MGSLYKLILKTNIKSPVIAFPLVFPLILILTYSASVNSQESADLIIITLLTMMTMQSGLMGFGMNFMNLKKSVLLRRIGATKMSKGEVLGAVMLYGMTIWLISIVWIISLAGIFDAAGLFWSIDSEGTKIFYHISWSSYNWGKMFFATIVGLYLSFAIGLFFCSIAKNIEMFQGMTMMYFFSAMFLGGLIFNLDEMPIWMEWVGYLIPHTYFADLFTWAGDTMGVKSWDAKNTADIIICILIGTLAIIGSIKFLKFD